MLKVRSQLCIKVAQQEQCVTTYMHAAANLLCDSFFLPHAQMRYCIWCRQSTVLSSACHCFVPHRVVQIISFVSKLISLPAARTSDSGASLEILAMYQVMLLLTSAT